MSLGDEIEQEERRRALEIERRRSERETAAAGGPETAGVSIDGDKATVSLPVGTDLGDVEELLRSRGLDPADWAIESVRSNEWEALAYGGGADGEPRIVTLRQLKVIVRNLRAIVQPAAEVRRRPAPKPRKRKKGPKLVVVAGDHHAPYHDPALHDVFRRWLAEEKPDEGIVAGDTLDLPTLSRFLPRKRWHASVQECVDAGYRLLSELRDANDRTIWRKMKGNHDWRLERTLLERTPDMAHVVPAGEGPDEHLFSVRRLLHLEALGIDLVGDDGEEWQRVEVPVAPGLVIRHEPPSSTKAARLARSVMSGHTHRQSIRYVTSYGAEGEPIIRTLVEVGTMAATREGLGYADLPDWQQGFATVAIWPDGTSSFDLAEWRDGVLTWRGKRYR